MTDYYKIYQKRLNRYGLNYQERVMTQRREVFTRRLEKSIYRIDFEYNNDIFPATFERYKLDNTEIMRYLFTEYDLVIPNGTVLMLPDPIGILTNENNVNLKFPEAKEMPKPKVDEEEETDTILRPWMVFYLEDTGAKGYNRYIMLKMTHFLKWKDRNKIDRESYAYMYGQEDNMLKDELRSRSRMDPLYTEALKMSFFVMPANEFVRKDDYFIIDKDINHKVLEEHYRVTGYDLQSMDGVEYVTVDPIYEYASDYYDSLEKEELVLDTNETDKEFFDRKKEQEEDYFWLTGFKEE